MNLSTTAISDRLDDGPDPPIDDSFDFYLDTITEEILRHSMRIIQIASGHPGTGVTTIAAALASLLSEQQGTVLLADAEVLARLATRGLPPTRSMYREIRPGYLSVLGAAEFEALSKVERGPAVSAEALMLPLKEHFDFVIIDAPAMANSKVAASLAPAVDGNLFLAVPYTTEINELEHARDALGARTGRLLGAIYNTAYQRFSEGA